MTLKIQIVCDEICFFVMQILRKLTCSQLPPLSTFSDRHFDLSIELACDIKGLR